MHFIKLKPLKLETEKITHWTNETSPILFCVPSIIFESPLWWRFRCFRTTSFIHCISQIVIWASKIFSMKNSDVNSINNNFHLPIIKASWLRNIILPILISLWWIPRQWMYFVIFTWEKKNAKLSPEILKSLTSLTYKFSTNNQEICFINVFGVDSFIECFIE